jgi:S1-C subfamily serine protease
LGSTVIKNVYDYTFALGKFKAGDSTNVTVLRGPREDKEVELQVTFPAKK